MVLKRETALKRGNKLNTFSLNSDTYKLKSDHTYKFERGNKLNTVNDRQKRGKPSRIHGGGGA
jgi:hypothetical protein